MWGGGWGGLLFKRITIMIFEKVSNDTEASSFFFAKNCPPFVKWQQNHSSYIHSPS